MLHHMHARTHAKSMRAPTVTHSHPHIPTPFAWLVHEIDLDQRGVFCDAISKRRPSVATNAILLQINDVDTRVDSNALCKHSGLTIAYIETKILQSQPFRKFSCAKVLEK